MSKYVCEKCNKEFKQASRLILHQNRKTLCVKEVKKNIIIEDDEEDNIVIGTSPLENYEYEKDEVYMKNYLNTILNKNGTYKRQCISPLRYAGGKSKAIGLILSNLPKLKNKKIVSPFFGGGSFELCLSQELDIEVVGYDIFGLLVNFWNTLINNKDEFIEHLNSFEITEEEFDRRERMKNEYRIALL